MKTYWDTSAFQRYRTLNLELRTSNLEKPGKATQSQIKATIKPPQSHILGIDSGVQSHTKATPMRPQGHPKAPPRLHQSHPGAKLESRMQHVERSDKATQSHGKARPSARAWGGFPALSPVAIRRAGRCGAMRYFTPRNRAPWHSNRGRRRACRWPRRSTCR